MLGALCTLTTGNNIMTANHIEDLATFVYNLQYTRQSVNCPSAFTNAKHFGGLTV